MAQAKTSPAQFLSEETPEHIAANKRYLDAEAALTEALTNRKMMFDPTLLAMAEGFLSPTRTGSFGESLGYAASKVGSAQEREAKLRQEMLERQLAVAGQGIELQRQKTRDKDITQFLRDEQPAPATGPLAGPRAGAIAGPAAAGLPSEPPTAAPAQGALSRASEPTPELPTAPKSNDAPPGFEGVRGIPVMPPNPSFMTQRQYVAANRNSKKSLGELMAEGAKLEADRYKSNEKGTIDLKTGMRYSYDDGTFVSVPIMGPGFDNKSYTIPTAVAMQLTNLARANRVKEYQELARKFTGGFGSEDGAKPVLSDSERELKKEKDKALQAAEIKQEVEDRTNFVQRARDADDSITTANVFRRFAADPNAKQMFGILSNDKVSSGIATLVRDGVGIPGFTVGTKAIEDVMRNANLNAADQAKYRTFLMYATQMQLQQSKYMKGAVSDFEQRLMANAGITGQDTPEAIRMKADLLTRRAQFDRRVAKAFKGSKMSADEFLNSDKYEEMRDKYNEDLADLSAGSKVLAPARPAAPAAGGNAPSSGYIKDPKTGVNRRRQPGE